MKRRRAKSILEKIYIAILLVVFGGIVLQGPLSVGLGSLWPNYDLLIKSWKEILMLVAGVVILFLLYKNKKFKILRDPILIVIAIYAALHLLLITVFHNGLNASLAGLAIDLRYVFFFSLVYIALNLYPKYRKMFIKVGVAGALVVLIFGLLQVFILPNDILKYIGYNIHTISPYLTVDQNPNFIRINSTLRGPNPLGAYAGLILTLVVAAITKNKVKKQKWPIIITAVLLIGGVIVLWASYSRSALIGVIIAIIVVLIVATVPKLSVRIRLLSAVGVVILSITVGIFIINNASFTSNVLLHENPDGVNSIGSNEGHVSSLKEGLNQLIQQPFGDGIGSTGSASLYSSKPLIIENQYLFTAHETGWIGLILFTLIFTLIITRLWKLRQDWLSLGVLASGICLAIIGLLLPVWVDDTVSVIWWGLAAVALFPPRTTKEL